MTMQEKPKREGIPISSCLILVLFLCTIVLFEYVWVLHLQMQGDLEDIKNNLIAIKHSYEPDEWEMGFCDSYNAIPFECVDDTTIEDYTSVGGSMWAKVKPECISRIFEDCTVRKVK